MKIGGDDFEENDDFDDKKNDFADEVKYRELLERDNIVLVEEVFL